MRKQFLKLNPRHVHFPKHVVKILKGVHPVKLAGVQDCIEHRCPLGPLMGTGKEVVLSSESNGSHLIFD